MAVRYSRNGWHTLVGYSSTKDGLLELKGFVKPCGDLLVYRVGRNFRIEGRGSRVETLKIDVYHARYPRWDLRMATRRIGNLSVYRVGRESKSRGRGVVEGRGSRNSKCITPMWRERGNSANTNEDDGVGERAARLRGDRFDARTTLQGVVRHARSILLMLLALFCALMPGERYDRTSHRVYRYTRAFRKG